MQTHKQIAIYNRHAHMLRVNKINTRLVALVFYGKAKLIKLCLLKNLVRIDYTSRVGTGI